MHLTALTVIEAVLKVDINWIVCLINELALRTMSSHFPILRTSLLTVAFYKAPCLRIQNIELVKPKYHFVVMKLSLVDTYVVKLFVLEYEAFRVMGLASDHSTKS